MDGAELNLELRSEVDSEFSSDDDREPEKAHSEENASNECCRERDSTMHEEGDE